MKKVFFSIEELEEIDEENDSDSLSDNFEDINAKFKKL